MITIPAQEARAERMDAHRQAIYDSNGLLCQAVLNHAESHFATLANALSDFVNRSSPSDLHQFIADAVYAEVERADRQRRENYL